MKNVEKFINEIKVYDCNLTKTRIGGNHGDGGYVALREPCELTKTVFSFGIENDVGFELDFANRFKMAQIRLFDPTIKSLPEEHERFIFFNDIGVGRSYTSLNDIVNISLEARNWMGCIGTKLLKMDIEWDEWHTLLDVDDVLLGKFSQLLIEFHVVHADDSWVGVTPILTPYFQSFYESVYNKINDDLFGMYYEIMKKLNDQFYLIHIHPNNSLTKVNVDGFSFPPLLEMSFVRKDLVGSIEKAKRESFPVEGLDFPNKTDRPDVDLGDILK